MKKIKIKCIQLQTATFFLLTLLAFVVFPSCQDTQDDMDTPQNREVWQKNGLYFSGCKENEEVNMLKSAGEKEACVTLQAVESNYLEVQHFDAVFNCVFDSLDIDYNIGGNVINIKEMHINPGAYCTCQYDIKYKIGPLEYGTYSINILDESLSQTEVSFEFEFTENTQMTYYKE